MRYFQIVTLVIGLGVPLATAAHDTGCIIGSAPPGSYTTIPTPFGTFHCTDPAPSSTALGTPWSYCYEETGGYPGLQRGGIGLLGSFFPPGCDQSWTIGLSLPSGTGPCLVVDEDPITSETCGHLFQDILIT